MTVSAASFTVQLAAPLANGKAHFINTEGKEVIEENEKRVPVSQTVCPGSSEKPSAEPGNLCVYETELVGAEAFSQGIHDPGPESGEGNARREMSGSADSGRKD